MKAILSPTGTVLPYPRNDDEPVEGLDPSLKVLDLTQDPEPTYDSSTHYLEPTEAVDPVGLTITRGWKLVAIPAPPEPPAPLTPLQKLEALGLTLDDVKELVELGKVTLP